MKKLISLLFVSMLALLVLGACNSANDKGTNSEDQKAKQEATNEQKKNDAEKNNTSSSANSNSPKEKMITYIQKGEQKESKAVRTDSKQQNYSVQVLDGFALDSEEPRKDTLYWKENDAVFMRIETVSTKEASYDIVLNNMKNTLKAVSYDPPKKVEDPAKLPTGEGIQNAEGYQITAEIGTVTAYVFEQNGLIVYMTIFDRKQADLTDAFLKMGQTIAPRS